MKYFICLEQNLSLTKNIQKRYHSEIFIAELKTFSGNEYLISLPNIQNIPVEVNIVHSLWPKPNELIIQLLMLIDSCKAVGVKSVRLIIPYLPYLRQDRQLIKNSSIGVRVLAKLMEDESITQIVTIDPHSEAAVSYITKLLPLYSTDLIIGYIEDNFSLQNVLLVAPDQGSKNRVQKISQVLNLPFIVLNKQRIDGKVSVSCGRLGSNYLDILIIDDIIDSGETISAAVKAIESCNAKLTVIATHLLQAEALTNLLASGKFSRIVVSNSITLPLQVTSDRRINIVDILRLIEFW